MTQQTSLKSYIELIDSGLLSEAQERVFNALSSMGEATDREITDKLGESDPNRIRPRRFELVELGFVGEAQKRKCAITGKTAIVWKVLEFVK